MRLPNRPADLERLGRFIPHWYDRAVRQNNNALRARYNQLKPDAVTWTDDLPFADDLVIRGETFSPHVLMGLELNALAPKIPTAARQRFALAGAEMVYYHNLWPAGTALETYMGARRGHIWFTTPVLIPVLAAGVPGGFPKVWMSGAPTEMFSQRAGVRRATGTVLVGGLGLGWFLRQVCRRKSVTRVIVVEQNEPLLTAFRPRLVARYPELAKVSDWICGDALDHVGQHGAQTRYLLDIWDSYNDHDPRFWALKKTTRYLWGWGQTA